MLCLVIGTYTEGLGLVLRIVLRNNLHSEGIYIAQYLFVVLSVRIPHMVAPCILLTCSHAPFSLVTTYS